MRIWMCRLLMAGLMVCAGVARSQSCFPSDQGTIDFDCVEPVTLMPEPGWWWTPSLAGSGFNLEYQRLDFDGEPGFFLFGSVFVYSDSGDPEWLTFAGRLEPVERWWEEGTIARFESPLYRSQDGQPLGSTYRPSTPIEDPRGPVVLEFTSVNQATLAFVGAADTRPIRRHVWGRNVPAVTLSDLEGVWRQQGLDPVFSGTALLPYVRFADIRPPQWENETERVAFMQLDDLFPGQDVLVDGRNGLSWRVYHTDPDTGGFLVSQISRNDDYDTIAQPLYRLHPLASGVFLATVDRCQNGCEVSDLVRQYDYYLLFRESAPLHPLYQNLHTILLQTDKLFFVQ